MTEVAKEWNPDLYPEIEAAGSLPGALQAILSKGPSRLVAPDLGAPFLVYAIVKRAPRSSQVMIAANHRAFSADFWHQGVQLGSGWASSLEEVASALEAFLTTDVSARLLHTSFPWIGIHAQADIHEQGPDAFVEVAWRGYIGWLEKEPPASREGRLLPLVHACMARPRLRRLMPFTSHDRLCFSRTTGAPYTWECPPASPRGEDTFRIERTDSSHQCFEGDARSVAIELERLLPADCEAAVHGTANDFGPRKG